MNQTSSDDDTGAATNADTDESFPELDAFLAEQKSRHATLIRNLSGVSLMCFSSGSGLLVWAMRSEKTMPLAFAGGLFLATAGAVGLARTTLSRFTSIDERPLPYGEDAKKLEAKLLKDR